MHTPICDFVREYAKKDAMRLHMPGHKGHGPLGIEALDITEIDGADSLYEAAGIISESEQNASCLFGCDTYYATEGSSQCIRAMLLLARQLKRKEHFVVAAGRNAHKTFLSAAALLDFDVVWLTPREQGSYLSCALTAEQLEHTLAAGTVDAVYLTSPDYLGNLAEIGALAAVCRRHGALLLVDNAHGAYLKLLSPSLHPIDLGADICCDSAHKTFPVLTGGAYLHLSARCVMPAEQVKAALALFGSTSPSYLILQSLDAANAILENTSLAPFCEAVAALKQNLPRELLYGDEPLKLTLRAKQHGYRGTQLADALQRQGIVTEFADPDFTVMMLTPALGEQALGALEAALHAIPAREPILREPPVFSLPQPAMRIREAMLAPAETVAVEESRGRILAAATVGCPPAVPIVVSGERIDAAAIECFQYYGITHCSVVQ